MSKKKKNKIEFESIDDLFNHKLTAWDKFIRFIWYTPNHKIKDFFYNLKCRTQRFKRGYAGEDWWNGIGYWFTNIGGQLFRDLKKYNSGTPSVFTTEAEYTKVIDEIIEGLDIGKKVQCEKAIFDTDFATYSDKVKKMDYIKELEVVSRAKFEKAMQLFTKYFGCFWD